MNRSLGICAIFVVISAARPAAAELCGEIPNTLILLDRSASMKKDVVAGQTRWDAAVSAVNSLTSTFASTLDFGLMLFPGTASYCDPGTLTVPCGSNTQSAIASAMQSTYPQNNTPLGDTMKNAQAYLTGLPASKPSYVIVITDGEESCMGAPTTVAGTLLAAGIKTYVVGFGAGINPLKLTPIAKAGGTTQYYHADNVTQLEATLQQIVGQLQCCGNGILDAGEHCDVGITPGYLDGCPTKCADGQACTTDILVGAACSQRCVFQPITTAVPGDGCCPPGHTRATDSDCPTSCGDGLLDAGEACDTGISAGLGACPASCDDANTCTADALLGSGCDARCEHTPITQPAAGDGCCPAGADHATDSDCPVLCGNGTLDAGEACDTAIAAGAPGACPTSCDDNNACTNDTLKVADCSTKCEHEAINQPADGDGCCPGGANNLTDKDCAVVCGNGALEQGEACDTAIASGDPGACPTECDDGDPCTDDAVSGSGCDATCATTAVPPKKLVADGCCPPGNSSLTDGDCPPPCGPDRSEDCVDLCAEVKCQDGEYCNMGKCEAWPDTGDAKNNGGSGGDSSAGPGAGDPNSDPNSDPNGDPNGADPNAPGDEGDLLGGTGQPFDSSGCGCAASSSANAEALPLLLVALLAILVRRRRA